ncbi:MAG: DUF86 domain-containing protein [Candidatus Sumerlaeota bacterium]|nr:DUF86 domain-containing protein [Candidatus Sumerlaeota bacterium]
MKRDYRDYIQDIVSGIDDILEFTKGQTYNDFIRDKKTINAVIRSLEVIGEAAKKVPVEIRTRYNDIPWKMMSGMRDKLTHEYFGVDLKIVWAVVTSEIPPIRPLMDIIIKEINQDI